MWKNIPEFKGYQVSENGSVRTFFKETKDKRMLKNKVLKQRGNYSIGARVDLYVDGKSKTVAVHRLVACVFGGYPLNTPLTVKHIDGNRMNNKLNNLELVSFADNMRHAFNIGLIPTREITLTRKGIEYEFDSMAAASRWLGRSYNYVSGAIYRKREYVSDKRNNLYKIGG